MWVNAVLALSLIVLLGTGIAAIPQFNRNSLDQRIWQAILFLTAILGWLIALLPVCAAVWRGESRWYLIVAHILIAASAVGGIVMGMDYHAPWWWRSAAVFCLFAMPLLMLLYLVLLLNPEWRPSGMTAPALHRIALFVFAVPMVCGAISLTLACRSYLQDRELKRRERLRRTARPIPKDLSADAPLAVWLQRMWSGDDALNDAAFLVEIRRRPNLHQELSVLVVHPDRSVRQFALRLLTDLNPFPVLLESQVRSSVGILIHELSTARPSGFQEYEWLIWRTAVAADISGGDYEHEANLLLRHVRRFTPSQGRYAVEQTLKRLRDR